MRRHVTAAFVFAVFAIALLLTGAPQATAQVKLADGTPLPDKPSFIVSYIEVAPGAAAEVSGLIQAHVAASRKEKGNLRFEALRRVGHRNQFVLLEIWEDRTARDGHAQAARTVKFRKDLQPHLYSPYDERPHVGLVAADPKTIGAGNRGTFYVVTHVDIIPTEQFPPCKRQVKETGPCGIDMVRQLALDSRKHKGMLRFDVLTQNNRPNHMKIVEMWTSSKAQDEHTTTAEVKRFRDTLAGIAPGSGVAADPLFVLNPLTGSLYDERFYRALR